jgi:hypothetical protein
MSLIKSIAVILREGADYKTLKKTVIWMAQRKGAAATGGPGKHRQQLTHIQSVPQSKHTPSQLYKPVS